MESTQAFQRSMEEFKEATEKRLDALEITLQSFMDSTESRFIAVENLLTGMRIKLDELDGKLTQRDAVEKLDNYLHKQIDPLEVLERRLLSRMFAAACGAGAITEEERDQLGDADALAVGEDKKTGELACAAAEVSTTVNVDDVEKSRPPLGALSQGTESGGGSQAQAVGGAPSRPPCQILRLGDRPADHRRGPPGSGEAGRPLREVPQRLAACRP
jgi:hypothetical protein